MTEGLIGVLAGTLTSLALKGVDLLLASRKERGAASAQDRDRLSADIWNLLKELRQDYDRLDAELQSEREARKRAEEQVKGLTRQVADLEEQVRCQETKTEKYKALADDRLGRLRTLAAAVTRLQTRLNGLAASQTPASGGGEPEELLDETQFQFEAPCESEVESGVTGEDTSVLVGPSEVE